MLNQEKFDLLRKTISVCNKHVSIIGIALDQTGDLFPLTFDKYNTLSSHDISFIDQTIYRFSKLQDGMGRRLFPAILEYYEEDIETMAFKDLLLRLEKLTLLPSAEEWIELREIRNLVTHDYPDNIMKIIEGLNLFREKAFRLIEIYVILRERIVALLETE